MYVYIINRCNVVLVDIPFEKEMDIFMVKMC